MQRRNRTHWIAPALLGAVLLSLLCAERERPLRRWREPGARRVARNVTVGAITAAAVAALESPMTGIVARAVERRRWGLMPRLRLPPAIALPVSIVLMDYTLYWWHVLLHRVPLLWRCHRAHHADLDLDTSTALRFHAAEFVLSIPWRVAQIACIGVTRRALATWTALTAAEVMFHHSNVRLPLAFERTLSRWVVTPRMHGIHHSVMRDQRDSNFSSGLSVWDLLHGTGNVALAQEVPAIGLPEYRRSAQVTLGRTLAMPFVAPESADLLAEAAAADRQAELVTEQDVQRP